MFEAREFEVLGAGISLGRQRVAYTRWIPAYHVIARAITKIPETMLLSLQNRNINH